MVTYKNEVSEKSANIEQKTEKPSESPENYSRSLLKDRLALKRKISRNNFLLPRSFIPYINILILLQD